MTRVMSHREAKEWAAKLIAMKNQWKATDAAREEAAAKEKPVDPDAVVDPENGKVFHYEKECSLLDEYYKLYLERGMLKQWDAGSMKARVEMDQGLWEQWVLEEKERHSRISEAYAAEGKQAPEITLPTMAASKGPARQMRRRHGSFVLAHTNHTDGQAVVPEPPTKAKKKVRFVLPGDPDDPWEQEAPKAQQRMTEMKEEAQATNAAWAEIVASIEHGEGGVACSVACSALKFVTFLMPPSAQDGPSRITTLCSRRQRRRSGGGCGRRRPSNRLRPNARWS